MEQIKKTVIEEYWLKKLSGELPEILLPSIHDVKKENTAKSQAPYFQLKVPSELTVKLKKIAKNSDIGLFILFLSALNICLYRYTGIEDLIVGTLPPSADGNEGNILFCRTWIAPYSTVKEVIHQTKKEVIDAANYSEFSLADILAELKIKNNNESLGIFKVALIHDTPQRENQFLERFDLVIRLTGSGAQIVLTVTYPPSPDAGEMVEGLSRNMIHLLEGIVDKTGQQVALLDVVNDEEKQRILYEFNNTAADYPRNKTIYRLFEEQVERTSDHIAIVGPTIEGEASQDIYQLTYRELNERSERLASWLKERGIEADTIVGIMVERSVEMITGIMGILKSEGAYLPIDHNYPKERIDYMINDSGAKILLTGNEITSLSMEYLFNSHHTSRIDHYSGHLAYIIYTSGSTGKPKGVMIEHHSLVNRLNWMQKTYSLDKRDTILQKTTFTFDVSVWEIFWWSIAGAKLCLLLPGGEKDPELITQTVEKNNVTTMHFVPSMLNVFLDYLKGSGQAKKLSGLKQVIASGEALFPVHVERFYELLYKENGTVLANLYGPTEATIDVSYFDCLEGGDREIIPIGKPIDNICLYILDKQFHIQPVGISGELCISGIGLARGYLNRPELTTEKFIFFSNFLSSSLPRFHLYRTGDIARWLLDGNIEFLGRIDHQVKVRGFRIELGEIESRLLSYPGIKEAVVLAREEEGGEKYLCAYFVCDGEFKLSGLRETLLKQLPSYMIPSYFIQMEKIPLTPSGKVDRRALPGAKGISLRDDAGYTLPTGVVERKLVEIWEKVLGRNNIGINDNFFMLGGDSIKSIQIISRMSSAGYRLEMKDIFQYPVISALAPLVKKLKRIPDQSPITGVTPLTPIQENFFNQSHIDPHHYNQAVMLYSRDGFDKKALKEVFLKIHEHHDVLRMTYKLNVENGKNVQFNHGLDYPFSMDEYDLRNRENSLEEFNAKLNEIQASIDLEKGPLMKLGLFHLDNGDRLLITVHHLVIDGVSWRILFEDIETLYSRYIQGEKFELPSKTDSFKLWAEKISEYANSNTFLKEKGYWTQMESKSVPGIPRDFEIEENNVKDTRRVSFSLGEEETDLLLTRVNHAFGTEINDILLTALGQGIKKTFEQDSVLIALEGHGREEILEDIDISRTVGWFTSVYPLLMDISYAGDLGRQIKEIKETLRRTPNKGIGYGILRYLTDEEHKKEIEFKLKPPIIFNYLGQFDADVKQMSFFKIAGESVGNSGSMKNRREYELDVNGMISRDRLVVTVDCNNTHFKSETMAALVDNFQSELRQLIAFCSSQEKREFTPSDFTYKELSIESVNRLMELYPDAEDIYTLTPMQEGMLFHALVDEKSYSYFEQMSYRLQGELDISIVEKSLNELFKRHEILRTAFVYEDIERPLQVVLNKRRIDIYYEDISESRDREAKEFFINEFKEKDKRRSFDLSKDVLMRVSILQVDHLEYEFTWSFHHILMDGWCIGILNNEFFEIYTGYLENRPYRLPELKSYRMYIQWLEKQDKQESAQYWQKYLDSYEEQAGVSVFGTKIPDEENRNRNETVSLILDGEKTAALNKLASRAHVTLNIVTQTLWGALLGKYNGKMDVVFGAVVSGRPFELEGVESMVGLFINTIPVRIRFEEKMKFYRLLQKIQEEAIAGEKHHYHPLTEIQSGSPLKQNLIDHLFIFENYPISEQIAGYGKEGNKSNLLRLKLTNVEVFEQTNYAFNVILGGSEQLRITFQYNVNVYDGDFVGRIAKHFGLAIDQVIENRDFEVGELTLLSEEEKNQILYEFNDTEAVYPREKTIRQLFEEQVERTPDNIAVVGSSLSIGESHFSSFERANASSRFIQISYNDLDEQSDRLAQVLQTKSVVSDKIVAIMVERSLEMMMGILGILKAGGAYLPIDPDYPRERIEYMLKDSGAKLLVAANDKESEKVRSWEGEQILLEFIIHHSNHLSFHHASFIIHHSSHLAYVIYTSGTTGKPKGVLIEHRNVVRLLFNDRFQFDFNDQDIWSLFHSYGFDFSVWEMYGALLYGGKLLVIPKMASKDIAKFLEILKKDQVTILNQTPSAFYNLSALELDSPGRELNIKYVIFGGEALKPSHLKGWKLKYPVTKLINMYGITETTVHVTFREIEKSDIELGISNIGKPIPTLSIYVFDKNLKLQPVGVPGELVIAGKGVGRGYLNRPELSNEKFVENPYKPGERLYKSGDLAKLLPMGDIQYLGRIDQQVKIRGFRIELGEIEAELVKHPDIKESLVLPREDKNGDKFLCAYIVVKDTFNDNLISLNLNKYLSSTLPDYMVPSYFVRIDEIPLTINGKLDRKLLPEPEINAGESGTCSIPGTGLEKELLEIWAEVLGIKKNTIGIDANFFTLGGHSLKATVLAARVHKKLAIKLPLALIFEKPTIRELAGSLKEMVNEEERYSSIIPAEKKSYYALSPAQKRLFILQRMVDGNTAYNLPLKLLLTGNIDRDRLERAFKNLISRHESLRTSFRQIDARPVQQVHSHVAFKIDYHEIIAEKTDEQELRVTQIINNFVCPFDLTMAPLLRVSLIKKAGTEHLLLIDLHHIITDGVSQNILTREFMQLYQGTELPALKLQYKDYSEWLISNKTGGIKEQEDYWINLFKEEIPVLNLPIDYLRPKVQRFEGSFVNYEIGVDETRTLNEMARSEGGTLFMVLLAVYYIFLAKISNQEDLVVGAPVAGRRHNDLESIVGIFINTLALRNYPHGENTFNGFFNVLKQRTLEAFENQDYQIEDLVEKLAINRATDRSPLFDAMFALQNMFDLPGNTAEIEKTDDFKIIPFAFPRKTAKYDLTLTAVEKGETLHFIFEYSTSLFMAETIIKFVSYFKRVVFAVTDNPNIRISEIEIISGEEKKRILYNFNDSTSVYPKEKTVHRLFEEQVDRTPGNIAIVGMSLAEDRQQLSYRELNEKANQLAWILRKQGVEREAILGIMLDRSIEMIISVLAVLKSGGSYLPIDPAYPPERIRYMLMDGGVKTLLTQNEYAQRYKNDLVLIDLETVGFYGKDREAVENLENTNSSRDLVYVIYTSGSTGQPRGVLIEHISLVNLCYWHNRYYGVTKSDNATLYAGFGFDASVWESFPYLITGATLHIINESLKLQIENLKTYFEKNNITIAFLPTQLCEQFMPEDIHSLRILLTGGDKLKVFEKRAYDLYNNYGPTENTVVTTSYFVKERSENIPIGRPIDNSRVYILNKDSLMLQPFGLSGELCIAGDGLSRGYLNEVSLTGEKFIENPYSPGERLYRTGDLARWLLNGYIEFLGRIDYQVKIRGFRIELSEIEKRILATGLTKEAVVTAVNNNENLCAYFTLQASTANSSTLLQPTIVSMLKDELAARLPEYMIPAYFVQLEHLPLTANGKIDGKSLPAPHLRSGESHVPPRNDLEKKAAEVWAEVLNIGKDLIGIDSNFFELGGHSLSATTMAANLHKELDVKVPLVEIFKTPTLRGLSQYIVNARKNIYRCIPPAEKRDYYLQSPAQKRLFFLEQFEDIGTNYNIPLLMKVEGRLDEGRFESTLKKLPHRHEALRTSFEFIDGEPVQRIHDHVDFQVEKIQIPGQDISKENMEETVYKFVRPFELAKAPLFRVGLLLSAGEIAFIFFDMHHIISDGASMQILAGEFIKFYTGYPEEGLSPIKTQYKDFSTWQNNLIKNGGMKEQENYWIELYSGEIPKLDIPTDYPRPDIISFAGDGYGFKLKPEDTVRLKRLGATYGTTLYMNLLAMYNVLLYKYTGQDDIIVGSGIEGRFNADLRDIIGMFVNMLAMRNQPRGHKYFIEFLKEVKENSINAFENQDVQFEGLVDKLALTRDPSRNPLFDTVIGVQNFEQSKAPLTSTVTQSSIFIPYEFERKSSKFDITLSASERGNEIYFNLEFCTALFKKETIERMAVHFVNLIGSVSENPGIKISETEIVSEEEKQHLLYDFNRTAVSYPADKTIHRLFESRVEKNPDSTALVFEDNRLTYLKVDEKADQLGSYLAHSQNVRPNCLVGIFMNESSDRVIAILGVLKAGDAYVPIDPALPLGRIKSIIDDAAVEVILSQEKFSGTLNRLLWECRTFRSYLCMDSADGAEIFSPRVETQKEARIQLPSNRPAYIIYTSGSTGKPRGVMIEHGSLVNLCYWHNRYYGVTGSDNATLYAGFGFDASVWESFPYLIKGAALHIISESIKLQLENLTAYFEKNDITIAFLPTQLCEQFMSGDIHSLRILLTGGEKLKFFEKKDYDLYNNYGPTENTVVTTSYLVREHSENIPIGKPIDNTKIYILAKGSMRLQPVGIPGELCISGAGLAGGYLNNIELTAEMFAANPFKEGERLYRTGDLCRQSADGNIQFLGRIDQQVKVRGFRIELGEIERKLLEHNLVKEAVVIDRDEKGGGKYLCAYIVPKEAFDLSELRDHLLNKLPNYMIPAHFAAIARIPMTLNGKVDRRSLPAIEINSVETSAAPRDRLEENLVEIWSEILGLEKDVIGIDSDFFALGGHSLRATLMSTAIFKRLNVKVPLKEIFKSSIIRVLANYIRGCVEDKYTPVEFAEKKEYYPLYSGQEGVYFIQHLNPENINYNLPMIRIIQGNLNRDKLAAAFRELVRRHESLRTTFEMIKNEAVQIIHDEGVSEVEYYEMSEEDVKLFMRDFVRPFALDKLPLFRVIIVKLQAERYILMFDIHHIITDAVSQNIFIREFLALYQGTELPPLKIQYKDFSEYQNKLNKAGRLRRQQEYWLNRFKGDIPLLNLAGDFPRPRVKHLEGGLVYFELDEELTFKLKEKIAETHNTFYIFWLAIFNIFLAKYSGQEDIVVGSPITGRTHPDLDGLIGLFVNMLAMRNRQEEEQPFSGFLETVKTNALDAFENQDYQFPELVGRLNVEKDTTRHPLFDVVFALNNTDAGPVENMVFKISPYGYEYGHLKFDLLLDAFERENSVGFSLNYSTALFKASTAEMMSHHMIEILKQVLENMDIKLKEISISYGLLEAEPVSLGSAQIEFEF